MSETGIVHDQYNGICNKNVKSRPLNAVLSALTYAARHFQVIQGLVKEIVHNGALVQWQCLRYLTFNSGIIKMMGIVP